MAHHRTDSQPIPNVRMANSQRIRYPIPLESNLWDPTLLRRSIIDIQMA
ncbi:MAG: hypothetical protein NW237_09345 [Cyanobacteriota bacterium]|nr:hypothetical protein [Cyanobacteriota bacterium]